MPRLSPAVARVWHGVTPTAKADDYVAFLRARAVPDYARIAGNRAVHLMHRAQGAVTHFVVVSHWDSRDSITAFAGDDIARAKYYPEDSEFLLAFEPTVEHYALGEPNTER
ncbi:MAG: hypothetical protein ABJA62_01880 [Luteimonas sp.]